MTTLTTEEIVDMTRQAGLGFLLEAGFMCHQEVKDFAKRVANKKHEELYRLAEEAPVRGDARQTRQNILHAIRGKV
jgi:hypothetical protein